MNQTVRAEDITTIVINEIMYNPEEDDNYNEWVELYNPTNQSINVSGWNIIDNFSEDVLEGDSDHGNGTTIIPPKGYAIIADHGTRIYENYSISNETIKLYVDDLSIGNGLGNTKDKLILKNSTGTVIDAMEWGEDYPDVPGFPAALVDVNHSLARYPDTDTNDSSIDFYDGVIPTPGSRNTIVIYSHLDIDLYPTYIPKVQNNSDYGIPFAIKTNMTNFSCSQTYQIKAYVIGNLSSSYPATQTWNGIIWKWSHYYAFNITTDEQGNWTDWLYLRFKKDYQEYQNNIMNNNTAYLIVKVKSDNISREISKKIYLLDMDESTVNGTIGGYVVDIAKDNNTILDKKTVIIKNNTDSITGIYVTEDNNIDDTFPSEPGYYKIPSPAGTNYSIFFVEDNGSILHIISNVTIEQGDYNVDIKCPETYYLVRKKETLDIVVSVENLGDFNDSFSINIDDATRGWSATLDNSTLHLKPHELNHTTLHIIPCQDNNCRVAFITLSATSTSDVGKKNTITFEIELLGPDINVTKIKCLDEEKKENTTFGEGRIVNIKAFVKNKGNENATDVTVTFYYDFKDKEHLIGTKQYDSIGKYQKYPSVEWDTTDVNIGNHTLFVIVDEENTIDELDESNNENSLEIRLYKTFENESSSIVITELYYHAHPRVNNEFITFYNPSQKKINISGWYLTNKPQKTREKQTKIMFPNNTTIPPETSLIITQNASAFLWETGEKPDYEYDTDSYEDIPQMICTKKFTLSNTGGAVALKDGYNHTIDIIVYGDSEYVSKGWNGLSVPKSGSGVILKRNIHNGIPKDTNMSSDWKHPRIYGIGQSDFPYLTMSCIGEIKMFVSPDCSFETIVSELRNATKSIYFNIYEFTNPFLCDELVAALKRGVSVNIFLEGAPVGGIDDREQFILNRIANNGGKIRFIVNDPDNDVYDRYRFDHGKYLVIDNYTVIVESCNWAKTGIPKDPTFGNREWGIVVRNKDVAAYFLDVFLDDWNPLRCDSYSFENMDFSIPPDFYLSETVYSGSYEPQFESKTVVGNFSAIPVFSPDTSQQAILDLINSAETSILIEQLYIYKDWTNTISPFVERLVNKSKNGVDIKVILNYNPRFEPTNIKQNATKKYLEENGIEVKFHYTNWSYFANVHNKGMIVDNTSVLISSINWNENSVTKNREAGLIITNEEIALYYAEVFFYDWNLGPMKEKEPVSSFEDFLAEYKNPSFIVLIYGMTFALVGRDWRKRKWT